MFSYCNNLVNIKYNSHCTVTIFILEEYSYIKRSWAVQLAWISFYEEMTITKKISILLLNQLHACVSSNSSTIQFCFYCIDHTQFLRKKPPAIICLCLCCEIEILVPILWYSSGMATSTLSRWNKWYSACSATAGIRLNCLATE